MLCFLGDSLPAFSNLIIGAARGVMFQAALLLAPAGARAEAEARSKP